MTGWKSIAGSDAGAQYEKVLANIEEVRARGGQVIAIVEEGDSHAASLAEHVLEVPPLPKPFSRC